MGQKLNSFPEPPERLCASDAIFAPFLFDNGEWQTPSQNFRAGKLFYFCSHCGSPASRAVSCNEFALSPERPVNAESHQQMKRAHPRFSNSSQKGITSTSFFHCSRANGAASVKRSR